MSDFPVIPYEQWVASGSRVRVNDGEIFYVSEGGGSPLVLAHMFGGNSWWYSRVLAELAKRFTVYAFDWPGCAQSDSPPLPYDIPDFAAALEAFMNALGIARAHLAGIGGGAMSSLEFAATRPDRVDRLILEVLPVWTRAEATQLWLELMRPEWLDENLLPRPFEEWGNVERTFLALDPDTRRLALERKAADYRDRGRDWVSMLTVGQLRYEAQPRLTLVKAPTLLINGELSDDHLRRREQDVLAILPDARLEIMPLGRVTSPFDQPQRYVDIVSAFLTS
jgi:pimeloyl-ACP methyl ester carboxylesterase